MRASSDPGQSPRYPVQTIFPSVRVPVLSIRTVSTDAMPSMA